MTSRREKRFFGEPYEKNGTTVIPVATIMGGGGGGEPMPAGAGDEHSAMSGSGMGFGVRATAAGVCVIRDAPTG